MAGFRTKLRVAIMLVVATVTLLALYFAERSLVANVENDLQREFESELAGLEKAQGVRHAALVERCRVLLRRPRIRAAFEDDALDVLYLNAREELRDIMAAPGEAPTPALRAQFYRFLDSRGRVISPPDPRPFGLLSPDEEARLALPRAPDRLQLGYLVRGEDEVSEVMAVPIFSSEHADLVIAGLVLGFKPFEPGAGRDAAGMKSGIWVNGQVHSPAVAAPDAQRLAGDIARVIAAATPVRTAVADRPHLLFARRLNPDSFFPPAHEICLYPLFGLSERRRELRWRVLTAGGLLLLVGLAGSHFAAARLSRPVERLAEDSEENRMQRARAEAALEMTSAELQRSARFSADASHQLKTPVTVLRAGLEELMSRENLTTDQCHEVSALIHQTYRLSSLIEDLLLLSRMDAGRLKLEFAAVNLSRLIEAALDDLSALPDELGIRVETDFPPELHISGEKRYTTLILHNLLENARKYNRPAGRIRIGAVVNDDTVLLTVGNTGRPISAASQMHIFERFHRGTMGENVPGYGLGLNLARELARLHQGDLRLVRSDEEWTEFEVRFRLAQRAPHLAALA